MAKNRTLGLKLRAVDKMSSTIDRVQKRFPKLTRSIQRSSRASKIFNAQTKQMRKSLEKIGGGMKSFGRTMTLAVTLPLLLAGSASVKLFGDFEQGLRGVEKTTGLTRLQVAKLGKTFDQLSTMIPVTTGEMLELAKAGGQLGITAVKDIEKFTIVMAKLSRTTDVAGEEGAKSIARILGVTGTAIDKVDRFSSALVELGNKSRASESEILAVANRIAGQIGRFDASAAAVLGIATALKSLGKNAESAGSVVGRSFDAIDQAIRGGGDQAKLLSKLTGIVGKDLKKTFKEDSTAVFRKFIEGLAKVQKGSGNLIKVMGALGLQGVRINDILGTLAKRPKVLAEQMDRASKAFRENTALQKEFAIQIDSINSSFIVISNTFKSLLTLIGAELAPVVKFFGKIFKGILDFLRNNPTIRTLVIVFGALAAVLGPIIFLLGAFLVILPSLSAGMVALGVASLPITSTFFLIAGAIAAVIAISVILFKKWGAISDFFNKSPFGKFVKFLFFVLTPLGQVIGAVKLLIAAFEGLDAFKSQVRDILPSFAGDFLFGKKKLGGERGARTKNRGVAGGGAGVDNFSGVLDVNFRNAPAGTNAKAKFSGPIDLNLGFAGGLQ